MTDQFDIAVMLIIALCFWWSLIRERRLDDEETEQKARRLYQGCGLK